MIKGFEVIGWLWRRIDPSEGPGMWHHSVNAELMSLLGDRDDHDVRDLAFADHARQLASQRSELLEEVRQLTVEHDDLSNGLRVACNYIDTLGGRSEVHRRILARNDRANATQQRKEPGA